MLVGSKLDENEGRFLKYHFQNSHLYSGMTRLEIILSCVTTVVCRKTNSEVNISHETTTMVVWIYDGI